MLYILAGISLWLIGVGRLIRNSQNQTLALEKRKSEQRVAILMIFGGSCLVFLPLILKYVRLI